MNNRLQPRWTVISLSKRKALAYIAGNRLREEQEGTIKQYCQDNNIFLQDIYCSEPVAGDTSSSSVDSTYRKIKDVIKERTVNTVIVSASAEMKEDFSEIKILKDLMFHNGIVFISIEEDKVWSEYQDFKMDLSPISNDDSWL